MQTAAHPFPSPNLLGMYKTFGVFGPAYQVIKPIRELPGGDWVVLVQVLETGEETEYCYSHLIDDPKAA